MNVHEQPRHPTRTSIPSLDPQDRINQRVEQNPALANMTSLTEGRSYVDVTPFCAHVDRYGYAILNDAALSLVLAATAPHGHKVLSLFTGLGYAEAQMAARGIDVIGFDRTVHQGRWLLNTHEGPGEMNFDRLSDRALFLSFPDPTKREYGGSAPASFIKRYLEAGGSTVITINEARARKEDGSRGHAITCDQEMIDLLAQGRSGVGDTIPLPAWPTVMCFVGRGHLFNDFRPVLKVHRF